MTGAKAGVSRALDATTLRGLAHPIRVQIMDVLGRVGPATSTMLAERMAVRTGTTSWHLHKLAEHGFIEEVVERGSRRERWWRAVTTNWTIDSARFLSDPESAAATKVLLSAVIAQHLLRAQQFLYEEAWPTRWREAWILNTWSELRLDPGALTAMREELQAVLEKYASTPSDTEDGEAVMFQMQGFPYRNTEQPAPPSTE